MGNLLKKYTFFQHFSHLLSIEFPLEIFQWFSQAYPSNFQCFCKFPWFHLLSNLDSLQLINCKIFIPTFFQPAFKLQLRHHFRKFHGLKISGNMVGNMKCGKCVEIVKLQKEGLNLIWPSSWKGSPSPPHTQKPNAGT